MLWNNPSVHHKDVTQTGLIKSDWPVARQEYRHGYQTKDASIKGGVRGDVSREEAGCVENEVISHEPHGRG